MNRLLKTHYTQAGVLFGKFWKGEKDVSRTGIAIPSSPYHMLSIRSRVERKDEQFFTNVPERLNSLVDAEDSGQNVFKEDRLANDWYQKEMFPGNSNEDIVATRDLIRAHCDLYKVMYTKELERRKNTRV